MQSRCCVPLCKGKYPTRPKVSVFSFPKNEDLKREWLFAIHRKDFSPQKGVQRFVNCISRKVILNLKLQHLILRMEFEYLLHFRCVD
ncbi:hypothetical protein X975_26041, partial [Stegodyphus mimosarum]